jgi:hypothetical protein
MGASFRNASISPAYRAKKCVIEPCAKKTSLYTWHNYMYTHNNNLAKKYAELVSEEVKINKNIACIYVKGMP